MAFKDPAVGTDYEAVLEDMQVVTLEVIGTQEGKDHGYGPTIEWFFHVWHENGVQYLDADGAPWELQQLTSEKLTKSEKGASKAREWGEVLLGGDLDDLEITGEGFARAIVGKSAKALIKISDKGFERIDRMSANVAAAAAPATAPAAPPAPPPPPAATAAAPAVEPDDLPF